MADTTTKQTMAEANSSARGTARDVDAVERQLVYLIDPHRRSSEGTRRVQLVVLPAMTVGALIGPEGCLGGAARNCEVGRGCIDSC